MISSWDKWFLGLCEYVSTKSKDPSTKVGAVIVDKNNRQVSIGYNGLPQKLKDRPEVLNNRELKYKKIIHAEINAIIFARRELEGCTLYTWPFQPCSPCTSIIIQTGIIRCVAPFCCNPRWLDDFVLSKESFDEAGVILELYYDELDKGVNI